MSTTDGYRIDLSQAATTISHMDLLVEDMQGANRVRATHVDALRGAWGDKRGALAADQLDKLFNAVQYLAHAVHNAAVNFAGIAESYRSVHEPERESIQSVSQDPLESVGESSTIKLGADANLFLAMDFAALESMASTMSSDMGNKIGGWVTRLGDIKSEISGNGNMAEKARSLIEYLEQTKGDMNELWQQFTDFGTRMKEAAEAVEAVEAQLKTTAGFEQQ